MLLSQGLCPFPVPTVVPQAVAVPQDTPAVWDLRVLGTSSTGTANPQLLSCPRALQGGSPAQARAAHTQPCAHRGAVVGFCRDEGLGRGSASCSSGVMEPLGTFLQTWISPFQAVSSQSAQLCFLAFPLCFLLASFSQADELLELLCWIPALPAPLIPCLCISSKGSVISGTAASILNCFLKRDFTWKRERGF